MSFDVHPILDAGDHPSAGIWYAVAPESTGQESEDVKGPCPRVGSSASSYVRESQGRSAVLVSAGATLDGPYSDLHQLSFGSNEMKWSQLPSKGFPARYEHASFMAQSEDGLRDELHVFAGAKPDCPVSDMWKYDLGVKSWKEMHVHGHIPTPRTFHSSSSIFHSSTGMTSRSGDLVVYSGGDMSTNPIPDQKTYTFNTSSNEWVSPATSGCPPSPRQGHVTAVVGHMLYVHGGMAGQTFLDDLHCLNLDTMKWFCPEVSGSVPPTLAAHGSAIINTRVFIFGGWSPDEMGPTAQDTLYCFHTETLKWEKIAITGPPPPARFDFAMCSFKIPVPHVLPTSAACTTPPRNKQGCDDTSTFKDEAGDSDHRGNMSQLVSLADDQNLLEALGDCQDEEKGGEARQRKEGRGRGEEEEIRQGYREKVVPTDCGLMNTFQAITVIDPEDGVSGKANPATGCSMTAPVASAPLRNCEAAPYAGEECDWVPALFIFGGMDSSGHVHGDTFIFIPSL